jgi:hypothetical protein
MATFKTYRLARPEMMVPMPNRGGRLFSSADDGEVIDTEIRFYATMIAERDLVEVEAIAAKSQKGK